MSLPLILEKRAALQSRLDFVLTQARLMPAMSGNAMAAAASTSVAALVECMTTLLECSRQLDQRAFAMSAEMLARARPRTYAGEPMLALSAAKRTTTGRARARGVGKRRAATSRIPAPRRRTRTAADIKQ